MGACCGSAEKPSSEPDVMEEEPTAKKKREESEAEPEDAEKEESEEGSGIPGETTLSQGEPGTPPTSNSKEMSEKDVGEGGQAILEEEKQKGMIETLTSVSEKDYEKNYDEFSPLLAPKDSESSYKRKSGSTDPTTLSYESTGNSRYKVVAIEEPKAMDSLGEKIDDLIALLSSEPSEKNEEGPEIVTELPEEEDEEEAPEIEELAEEVPAGSPLQASSEQEAEKATSVKDEQFALVNYLEKTRTEKMNFGKLCNLEIDPDAKKRPTSAAMLNATTDNQPQAVQCAPTFIVAASNYQAQAGGRQLDVSAQLNLSGARLQPQPQIQSQPGPNQMMLRGQSQSPRNDELVLPTAVTILDQNHKPLLVLDVSLAVGNSGLNTLRIMNASDWDRVRQQRGVSL